MSNVISFFIGLAAGSMMGAILMGLMCASGDYDRREEEELSRKHYANGKGTVSEGLETDSKGDKGKG